MFPLDSGVVRSHRPLIGVIHRWFDLLVIAALYIALSLVHGISLQTTHLISPLVALFVFYVVADGSSLYASWRGDHTARELRLVFGVWSIAFTTMLVGEQFVFDHPELTRMVLLQWYAGTLLMLCVYRAGFRHALHVLRAKGYNVRAVAIVGTGKLGQRLGSTLVDNPWMGMKVEGFYDDAFAGSVTVGKKGSVFETMGDLACLVDRARRGYIDRVFITLSMKEEERFQKLLAELTETTVSVHLIPDVFVFELLHARTERINGLPSISLYDTPMFGINRIAKGIMDRTLAFLILLGISPILLALAIGVKMSSPGPVFYRQERVSLNGKPFGMLKFRSMPVDTEKAGVQWGGAASKATTRFGQFIRKTSLDELPQFINVLKGEMSIVGPRPERTVFVDKFRKEIPRYMQKHMVKAGITGWAQINGWRGDTDLAKRIEYDLHYINNWSIWLDIKIIFLTFYKGFVNENAY